MEPFDQDQEEKKSSKMKEDVKSKEKPSDILEESIEALEEIASGIINWFSKLPVVDECSLCKERKT